MSFRQILPLAVLVTALMPATALAAPTVTVTGDDGNPVPLNALAPIGIRNMDVTVDVAVPTTDTRYYTSQVLDAAGTPASSLNTCRTTQFSPTARNFADYRGNGTYTVVLRYYNTVGDSDCNGAVTEQRFAYTVNAGTAVTAPAARLLTRLPNTFLTRTHQIPVALNPGALTYEIRYALGGVAGPDGAISGPRRRRWSTAPPGSRTSASTSPGAG